MIECGGAPLAEDKVIHSANAMVLTCTCSPCSVRDPWVHGTACRPYLDCREHNGRIGMLQAGRDALHDALCLSRIPARVLRKAEEEEEENEETGPLKPLSKLERVNWCVCAMTHSVHSFSAASSLNTVLDVTSNTGLLLVSWISVSAATALATTMGLLSDIMSRRESRKPLSSTSSALMSWSFATQMAAVFRT